MARKKSEEVGRNRSSNIPEYVNLHLDEETRGALARYESDLARKVGSRDLVPSRTAIVNALLRRALGVET